VVRVADEPLGDDDEADDRARVRGVVRLRVLTCRGEGLIVLILILTVGRRRCRAVGGPPW